MLVNRSRSTHVGTSSFLPAGLLFYGAVCTDGVGNGIALDSEEHAMAKKIACRTGGVYRGVKDDEDAALAIRMYYERLAK